MITNELMARVIDQTKRRVVRGENVPAGEKVVSIVEGNPPDESLAIQLVERQEALWGRVPRQTAFDGGFASKRNLDKFKTMGVKDASFSYFSVVLVKFWVI